MCCCCFCDGLRREGIGLRTGFLFPAVLLTLSTDFIHSAMNSFESTRTNFIAPRVLFCYRSKTKNALSSPRARGPIPNRPVHSRNLSSSCRHSCQPFRGTRSTFGRVKTETSARCGARRDGSSTLVSLRA